RARISRRILWNKDKFTFDEWAHAGFDTYVIQSETEIPELVNAWEKNKVARVADAVAELQNWDHISRTSSVPMTLFVLWHEKQYGSPFARAKTQDPVQSLEQVLDDLTANFGAWRVPWGDLNRLERRPAGGGEPFRASGTGLPCGGG